MPPFKRVTQSSALRLVPIESLPARDDRTSFAIVPPWRKPVYADPESGQT
jgi:hypothetical protein